MMKRIIHIWLIISLSPIYQLISLSPIKDFRTKDWLSKWFLSCYTSFQISCQRATIPNFRTIKWNTRKYAKREWYIEICKREALQIREIPFTSNERHVARLHLHISFQAELRIDAWNFSILREAGDNCKLLFFYEQCILISSWRKCHGSTVLAQPRSLHVIEIWFRSTWGGNSDLDKSWLFRAVEIVRKKKKIWLITKWTRSRVATG